MASHSTSSGEAGGTVLRAFLTGCGLGVGAESATVAALAEALSQQGLKSPEDLGALAPKGTLFPGPSRVLAPPGGPGGGILLDEAVRRGRAVLLPWAERLASNPRPVPALLPLKPKVPGPPAPPRVPLMRPVSQKQVAAAERRLSTLAVVKDSPAPPPLLPASSLRDQERAQMDAALACGMAFFQALGPRSPRYRAMYPNGHHGDPGPSQDAAALQLSVIQAGIQAPKTLRATIRKAEGVIAHLLSLSLNLEAVSEWPLAAFLLDFHRRGKNAREQHRAIVWAAKVCVFIWPAHDPLILAQRDLPVDRPDKVAQPQQALCPTLDMLRSMEELVRHAPNPVLQIFAGVSCLLAHGCLRASDAQHSQDLYLTGTRLWAPAGESRRNVFPSSGQPCGGASAASTGQNPGCSFWTSTICPAPTFLFCRRQPTLRPLPGMLPVILRSQRPCAVS